MKRTNKINIIISALLLSATITGIGVFAAGDGGYSSSDDPLVSLSYINDVVIPQLKSEILAEVSNTAGTSDVPSTTDTAYEVVHINLGQSIIASAPCEIILRSGSAVAVTVDAGQGLSDLTASSELLADAALTKNHYVIIPRGDGRGVIVTSGDAYFMVRGEYTIVG